MKFNSEKTADTTSTTATRAEEPFFGKVDKGGFFEGAKQGKAPAIQAKLTVNQLGDSYEQEADKIADQVAGQIMRLPEGEQIQPQTEKEPVQIQSIVNGGEIIAALSKTPYGLSLIAILENSGLEYVINIRTNNNGKFGDPKKNEEGEVLKGYELNFQKYDPIEVAGTRYDHAGKDEYYGAIAAHDVIDTATTEGIAINKKKDKDWANPDSEFKKSFGNWQNAKAKNREGAKTDFIQFMIDNYEKIGMDAELKFREGLGNHTLDEPIGELSFNKQLEGQSPNLKGKTPRDIYTKGLR